MHLGQTAKFLCKPGRSYYYSAFKNWHPIEAHIIQHGMKTKSLQDTIDDLKPGEEVELSRANGFWVTAERSGNGKTIRYVRHSDKGFVVIKSYS